jgi:hypothetical protein
MLKGPKALEFDANLTIYVVQPVTDICCSISVLQPGALLTTVIVYRDIRGFLFNKYHVDII